MRRLRRAATPLLALALLGSLSSCVIPSNQDTAIPKRFVESPKISPKATDKYGDEAARAYQEIAAWILDHGEQDELLDPTRTTFTAAELTRGITAQMTPGAATEWENLVAKAVAGDVAAEDEVQALRYFKLYAPGLALPNDGTAVESQAITGGTVDIAPNSTESVVRLKITFTHETRIKLLDGKSPYRGTITNALQFTVLPAALVAPPVATKSPNPTTSASSAASGSPEPTTATAPSGEYTRDPAATWLVSTFDGDVQVSFDQASSTGSSG